MHNTRYRPMPSHHAPSLPVPDLSRRWVWLAVIAMILATALLVIPYPVAISDTWMLVLSGRFFLAQGVHAIVDPFSYAAPNLYIEHEWLPAVLFALLVDWGGWPALLAWKGLLVAGIFALAVWTARRLGASWGVVTLGFLPLVYVGPVEGRL